MKVEMAALVAGVQYGLSQGHFNENKSLIFVKLTDSAFRAIEEYSRNRNKCIENPTIQFLDNGNEGRLSFPSISQPAQQRGGRVGFNFSLSSNADIEGPQGSFECIKQNGPKLETVGSLQCKMRIHGNEDIFEATRTKMAAVEQQQKKNCTREIELNKTTGVGRKLTKSRNNAPKIDPIPPLSYSYPKYQNSSSNIKSISNSSTPLQKHGNPDIVRQPLRTRLIHLLAVRNYKKPEIYAAISRDGGMKERDKNQLMPTLLNIASVRDNTYRLSRHIWNEVREDWPFYNEQERQMLKRNKPQNLTPPGNSDGGSSASSGQSPGSNHPGSPPSAIEGPSMLKRPGYFNGVDGIQTKRHRVSHYRKPATGTTTTGIPPIASNYHNEELGRMKPDYGNENKKMRPDNMDLFNSNSNERSPLSFNAMTYTIKEPDGDFRAKPDADSDDDGYHNMLVSSAKSLSNNRNTNHSVQHSPVVNNSNKSLYSSSSVALNAHNRSTSNISDMTRDARHTGSDSKNRKPSKLPKLASLDNNNDKVRHEVSSWLNNSSNDVEYPQHSPGHQNTISSTTKHVSNLSESVLSSSLQPSFSNFTPSSEPVPVDSSHLTKESALASSCNQNVSTSVQNSQASCPRPEQPAKPLQRFMKDYTTIKTLEQRRKYKDDFNANYSEYKTLHRIVEQTTAEFTRLEEKLKRHQKNTAEYEKIKKEIVLKYKGVKNNKNYQQTKVRFQYLHDKLSHIKKLVSDFDSLHLKSSSSVPAAPLS